jgi:hypothetical protein
MHAVDNFSHLYSKGKGTYQHVTQELAVQGLVDSALFHRDQWSFAL